MRIAGYIQDDLLKITVFQYEGKFSVQFETPHYAQIFKIRNQEGLDSFEQVKTIIDDTFIEVVKKRFQEMHLQALSSLNRRESSAIEQEFDEII